MSNSKKINSRCVWPRDQVAHLWAAQSPMQTEARESNGRVSYFNGPTLFSYGQHYVAGHFTDAHDAAGRRIVLVSSNTYSNITGTVCGARDRALRSLGHCVIRTAPDQYLNNDRSRDLDIAYDLSRILLAIAAGWRDHANAMRDKALNAREHIGHRVGSMQEARINVESLATLPAFAGKVNKEARGKLQAIIADLPDDVTFTRRESDNGFYSWSEIETINGLDVKTWQKSERVRVKQIAAERAARDAIALALLKAREYAADKKANAPAGGLHNAAVEMARYIARAHDLAKKARVALPKSFPRADYYVREDKRLVPLVAVVKLTNYAHTLRSNEASAVRALAHGSRYQARRGNLRGVSRNIRARALENKKTEMPQPWQRIANIRADQFQHCRDEASRFANEARPFMASRDFDAAVTAINDALRGAQAIQARILRAQTVRHAFGLLETVRERAERFARMSAMSPGDIAGEIAAADRWHPAPMDVHMHYLASYDRARDEIAQLDNTHGGRDYLAREFAKLAEPTRICPAVFRAADALSSVYRGIAAVNASVNATRGRIAQGMNPGAVRSNAGGIDGALGSLATLADRFNKESESIAAADLETTRERIATTQANARDAMAEAEAYALAYVAPTIATWRTGGALPEDAYSLPVALRLSAGHVETSHGAQVDADAARMLWRLVARTVRTGKALHTPPPVRVGAFELRHIHANGDAQVGCHLIPYAESLAFAQSQAWTADAESDAA